MNTNDKKPAAFTTDIFTVIPCSGGSYLRAPGNVRIFYGQIAAVVYGHFPELIEADALEQIAAMPGAQSWFDKSESPYSIPYSFSDQARYSPAAVIARELRACGQMSLDWVRRSVFNHAHGVTANDAEQVTESAIEALKKIGAIYEWTDKEGRAFSLDAEDVPSAPPTEPEPPAARDIIAELEQKIADDLTKIDREARFDESINESYSFGKIGGPFAHMQPAAVLKKCDPTAYRCGVNDYQDGEGWIEVAGENYDAREVEEKRDELIDDLEDEITQLEEENEENEENEESEEERERNNAKIETLKSHIARLKNHSF